MSLETSEHLSSKIQLLPEHLIDQIKAGEVVEGPAFLLKELIENSLDAKATSIRVHIMGDGLDLIRVEDNGEGMALEDLPFAFLRHATSKLRSYQDLYNLYSYGFRGEALASISSVSKIQCFSRQKGAPLSMIELHGGQVVHHHALEEVNEESGTTLIIQDLFYNTPVRLKFLKSGHKEKIFIKRLLQSFVLINPHVHFSFKWDQEDKEEYPAQSEEGRFQRFLCGKKRELAFSYFHADYDDMKLDGAVVLHRGATKTEKGSYLFVNNRYIQDKTLLNQLTYPLDHLLNDQGVNFILRLTLAPYALDVNVHPNKIVVKFERPGVVSAFLSHQLETQVKELLSRQEKEAPNTAQVGVQTVQEVLAPDRDFFSNKLTQSYMVREESEINLRPIGTSYALYLFGHEEFILHLPKMVFIKQYMEITPEQTPLLISPPLAIATTPHESELIKRFKQIGLELERAYQGMLLLKEIPLVLHGQDLSTWLRFITFSFEQKYLLEIGDLVSLFLKQEWPESKQQLSLPDPQNLANFPESYARYFIRPLNDTLLNGLFRE